MRGRNTYLISLLLITLNCLTNASGAFSQQIDPTEILRSHSYFAHISENRKSYFLKMHPDSIKPSDSSYSKINYPGTFQLKKNFAIFGWHVSWMRNSYRHYNYSLLTHIAYFGCEVDPAGGIRSFNGWNTTDFVPYVKSQNPQCKVLLTATCFGKSIDTLLQNASAQASLIQKLTNSIIEKKADGICIDFEGVSSADKEKFSTFITNLKLNFQQHNLMVSITLPAVDYNKSFDFVLLGKSVDLFIMMGYDYFGSFSRYSGPVAPLKGKQGIVNYNVETSIYYYLNNNVSASSLLLAVPYFGAIWETNDSIIHSSTTKFWGYRPYSYELKKLKYYKNDTVLKASYRYFLDADSMNSNSYRQFWLDGVYALGAKYDFILEKKLGGVGIWALGFDSGSDSLWNLLQTKFSKEGLSTAPTDTSDIKTNDFPQNLISLLNARPISFAIIIFLLLTTLLVVLLKVVSSSQNIDKLKNLGLYYIILLTITVIFFFNTMLLLLVCFNLSVKTSIIIFISFAICILLFKFFKNSRNKGMP